MEPLKLKPWGSEKRSQKDAAPFVQIVQTLDSQIRDNKLNIIRLFGYSHPTMPEYPPVTCRLEGNDIVFEAQNYVGMFATGEAEIKVSPRFGEHTFMMLMAAAANIYLPSLGTSMDKDPFHNETLLRLLWKAQLRQAIARAALPQSFITESGNLKNFRGRLEVRPHIRHNLLDASRFYCVYSKLSADNIINRVILNVLRRLKKQHNAGPELIELEDRLESLGVRDTEIRPSDMEKIRYTAMTEAFRPLMETSRILLSNGGARSGGKTRNENTSFFIDMTELWETFLLRTLKRHLGPEGYTVISPNTGAPIYLLENHAHMGARKIRPDIIILRRERPLLIIDAKYKNYQNFGAKADNNCVSREDLYQLATYMYYHGAKKEARGQALGGLFTAPVEGDEEIYACSGNKLHAMGLFNLDLDGIGEKDKGELARRQKQYATGILRLLKNIEANKPEAIRHGPEAIQKA